MNLDDLMTHEEVVSRLDDGEDPFVLVLEKWKRILELIVLNDPDALDRDYYDCESCAFCFLYDDDPEVEECENCPLFQHLGYRCYAAYKGPWWEFSDAVNGADHRRMVSAASVLIDTVRAARKEK